MNMILLLGAAVLLAMYSVSMKFIPKGNLRLILLVTSVYTGMIFLVCLLLIFGGEYSISGVTMVFGALWGIGCVMTQTFYFLAMQRGPLSYTTFIFSSSMMIPVLSSALLWEEEIKAAEWLGIVLFLASFYLVGVLGANRKGEIQKSWLPLCLLAFVTNGMLMTIVKAQQIAAGGSEVIPMLAVSFGCTSSVAFFAFVACGMLRKELLFPKEIRSGMKKAVISTLCIAFCNGASNGLVTYLSSRVAASWLFPCVQGGNMILVTLFSVAALKEKINKWGWIGLVTGLIAVIVLNVQ